MRFKYRYIMISNGWPDLPELCDQGEPALRSDIIIGCLTREFIWLFLPPLGMKWREVNRCWDVGPWFACFYLSSDVKIIVLVVYIVPVPAAVAVLLHLLALYRCQRRLLLVHVLWPRKASKCLHSIVHLSLELVGVKVKPGITCSPVLYWKSLENGKKWCFNLCLF